MKQLTELKQVHDAMMRQVQAITTIVNPQAILQHGHLPPEKMLVMLADGLGLIMLAQARIIEVLIDVLEPKGLQ